MYKRTNLAPKPLHLLVICLFALNFSFGQQRVGLVLSGGGATGLAHIGVLKALEENNIPIDYITGTSAGALIGSMYAAGFSPEEIEAYVLSEDFQTMSSGGLKPEQHFLFRQSTPDASMISLAFAKDSLFRKSLPTNFNSSAFLDFEMLKFLGTVGANKDYNFDSLYVPFRCVAADIVKKESVIFDSGNLNAAVRASMTFPFYIKPTRIDDVLLFDGGLYNNFPADVMYTDFSPDFIIGSNVSYNADPPDENNLISQITNMLVTYSDFSLPCDAGIIIEPETEVQTFDFSRAKEAIDDGYRTAIKMIDSIKVNVQSTITLQERAEKRAAFKKSIAPPVITSVSTSTGNEELRFTRLSLIKSKKDEFLSLEDIERRYYRLYAAPQIDFIYPTLEKKKDSTYNLEIKVSKAKEFKVDVGGHISSRPVNTGYLGVTYQTIGRVLTKSHVETYFGKFYGSAKGDFTIELPAIFPISTTGYLTLNRWDYFRSFSTFFEDVQPSYLVQEEIYSGLTMRFPIGNTTKSEIDARYFQLEDRYYQNAFTNKDTADLTEFDGVSLRFRFSQNSLNRKQFASSGHKVTFDARLIIGDEHSVPGSTSFQNFEINRRHSWINLGLDYQSFIVDRPRFHLGLHGLTVFSSQKFFANYTATMLSLDEFSLIPDATTTFLPEYRAPQFISVGTNFIFSARKNLDFRLDAYLYQPILRVVVDKYGSLVHSPYFTGETYIASASAIYHSFLGPIRTTINYYPEQKSPLSFQISFGYVLFNERAIR